MPYRDELEALRSREEALARELDEARRMRAAAERRALPVLETLRVASPCPEKWENMVGDATTRFCARCAKNVYDLSAMTREEAERFVADRPGPVCVTMRQRRDGTLITDDCPVGARRKRVRRGLAALAVTGAAAASASTLLEPVGELPAYERRAPAVRAEERRDLVPKRCALWTNGGPSAEGRRYDTVTTGMLAAPPRTDRTTGCLCAPGDPLCSCL